MRLLLISMLVAVIALPAHAQRVPEGDPVVTEVADNLYMLEWAGGNIGISVGEDGVVLVDDQYAPMVPKNLAALREITDAPLRFVLNTHWHGDHTGGNEQLAGEGALIIAHDNVRKRLSEGSLLREIPAAPDGALPVVTFDSSVTLHFNGHEVHAYHVGAAHTDGDSVVHFRSANVIHTGDIFFNGRFPFIDGASGGNVAGVLEAVDGILKLCSPETKIIPGHGPLTDCDGLRDYKSMLTVVHERIAKLIAGGATADEVVAAKPAAEYADAWTWGFMPTDRWVRLIYDLMAE